MTDPTNGLPGNDPELQRAVQAIRSHWRRRRIVEGLPAIVAAALVAVLIGVALHSTLTSPGAIVTATRVIGYLLLVGAFVLFVVVPALRRANDEQIALYVEEQAPEMRQLFLSAVHGMSEPVAAGSSPSLRKRLVQRAVAEIERLEGGAVLERRRTRRALGRLGALVAVAIALIALGPAPIRDMARVLFVPWSRAAAATVPALNVAPGNISVPRGAALDIRADLRAAIDHGAEIVMKADSAAEWTRIAMVHDSTGAGYVARLFDINRNATYYVEAGGLKSPEYRITVTDLPTVKQLALEIHYPSYTGLPTEKIENGGDVAAVTNTTVTTDISPTLPVTGGSLHFDDGTDVPLTLRGDGHLAGSFKVQHDGFYRVDMIASDGTRVPGTVQHSVEALVDHAPMIRIDKPGRDTRVNSVEEVPLSIRASDDYGVRGVELHYTVNGGADHVIILSDSTKKSSLEFNAVHTLFLEEFGLHVGDLVAYHAVGKDGAGNTASSDIYFMEVRAFGKDYHAAEDNGGGGGGGGGPTPGKFTERQRELVAGTFNWQRDSAKTSDRDRRANATTLAIGQGKLRTDVAAQLAQLIGRNAAQEDSAFKIVIAQFDSAVQAMKPAEDGLGRHVMRDAIPAEEKSLQHLQAADEVFRDIQVRQQQGGGGGGGGGGGAQKPQDLADLFEMQTDKQKNQYEAPRSEASSTPAQQAIDSAQEKLKELAARQLAENERQRQAADALAERMGQGKSAQGQPGQGQSGQGQSGQGQSGQGQSGQGQSGQGQQGQQGSQSRQSQQLSRQNSSNGPTGSSQRELARQAEEQARQLEKLSRDEKSPELADAAQKLQQAADAMRQAAAGSQPQGAAALDRLRQATSNLSGAASAGQGRTMQELADRANELRSQQQSIARDVAGMQTATGSDKEQRAAALDKQKDALASGVQQLASDAQKVSQQVRRDQPKAAAAAQTAADELRNRQVAEQIGQSKRVMRDGMPDYSRSLENLISETLDTVSHRLATATGAIGSAPDQQRTASLAQTRDLVNGMQSLGDRMARADNPQNQNGAQNSASAQNQNAQNRAQNADPNGRAQNGARNPAQDIGAQRSTANGRQGQQGQGQQGQKGQQGQGQQGQGQQGQGQQGQQGQGQQGQRGQGQQGQGQQGQGQQGQGQQGQGQQGQGQQGQGQQGQGQQGQRGQGQGQGQQGGANRSGQPNRNATGGGMPGGDVTPTGMGDPRQFQREVQQRTEAAESLKKQLSSQGVDVGALDMTIDQMKQLQTTTNPGKADQLQAAIVAGLKEFEFNVWKKLNAADFANRPALGSSAQVPPEYRAMVEQYYRSLARKGPK